jgi:hypothetical protein
MMPDEEEGGFLEDLEQAVSPAVEVISDYANQPYSPVTDPLQQIETYASAATETALGNASETYQTQAEYGSGVLETAEQVYADTSVYIGNLYDPDSMPLGTDDSIPLSDDTGCADISFGCTTTASFSYSNSAPSYKTSPGTGCDGCTGADCVRVTGTVTITYTVTTTIAPIPTVANYPKLKPCQKERLQKAINNLKKHEDEHVKRFKTYNGTETLSLNFVACRDDIESKITEKVSTAATAHQSKAQALSDAIDPFMVVVDCDC